MRWPENIKLLLVFVGEPTVLFPHSAVPTTRSQNKTRATLNKSLTGLPVSHQQEIPELEIKATLL